MTDKAYREIQVRSTYEEEATKLALVNANEMRKVSISSAKEAQQLFLNSDRMKKILLKIETVAKKGKTSIRISCSPNECEAVRYPSLCEPKETILLKELRRRGFNLSAGLFNFFFLVKVSW